VEFGHAVLVPAVQAAKCTVLPAAPRGATAQRSFRYAHAMEYTAVVNKLIARAVDTWNLSEAVRDSCMPRWGDQRKALPCVSPNFRGLQKCPCCFWARGGLPDRKAPDASLTARERER
jgi:hypothetical protein